MYQMKLSMSAQWEPVRYRPTRLPVDKAEEHGVVYVRLVIKPGKATVIPKVPIYFEVSN
jgi:hypothetical protein